MSTYIKAFIPDTDKDYQKHKKVFLACLEARVSLPKETAVYFDTEFPEEYFLEEKLSVRLKGGVHFTEYKTEDASGFEVDLQSLPEGVTKLRFYNSW